MHRSRGGRRARLTLHARARSQLVRQNDPSLTAVDWEDMTDSAVDDAAVRRRPFCSAARAATRRAATQHTTTLAVGDGAVRGGDAAPRRAGPRGDRAREGAGGQHARGEAQPLGQCAPIAQAWPWAMAARAHGHGTHRGAQRGCTLRACRTLSRTSPCRRCFEPCRTATASWKSRPAGHTAVYAHCMTARERGTVVAAVAPAAQTQTATESRGCVDKVPVRSYPRPR